MAIPLRLPRLALAFAALVLLAASARATWSIVVINRATGEVAVGCATCVAGYDLKRLVPVIRPGLGAAAAQSYVDQSGRNRRRIWDELFIGTDPVQMLQILAGIDPGHQTRQYGIVDLSGRAATFTGTGAGAWAGGVTGQIGEIFYAIQGNVITGQPVVTQAELALRNTPGDLAEKLMAAMEAARAMGGDGRCSCRQSAPTACGAPPTSFTHSAYIGFMIIGRIGDSEGTTCNSSGCAFGNYYLDLNFPFANASHPDPVLRLRQAFDTWRQQITGRPDHILSVVRPEQSVVAADGFTRTRLLIAAHDWAGTAVSNPGLQIAVAHDASATAQARIGQPVHIGGPTWAVDVWAPEDGGTDVFRVTIDDGSGAVLLYPFPEIQYLEVPALQADRSALSAAQGGPAHFALFGKRRLAQRDYLLLLSLSGTQPGIALGGGVVLPLNFDDALAVSADLANTPFLANTLSRLAADGRSIASFNPPAGAMNAAIGMNFHFAWLTLFPADFASNPVQVTIQP